jgi:hypothetical protein
MLEFHARLTAVEAELQIAYEIVNRGPEVVFAFTLATDGRRRCYPHAAYASLAEGGAALHLHLGECPAPPDVSLVGKALPFAYRVGPGQTYAGRITVPLPAREWDAYHGPDDADAQVKTVRVQKVVLTVECVPEGDVFFAEKVPSQEYFQADGYPVAQLRSEFHLTEPVPVLRRTAGSPAPGNWPVW